MTLESKPSNRKEIRNLLFVVGSGVFCALSLALLMLYYYNPTGRYLAKNVLLAPEIMTQISYPETNPHTGVTARYTFDRFEFAYFEPTQKEWIRSQVSPETYREFFQAVAEDMSLISVTDNFRALFNQGHPTTLTVHMRGPSQEKITFQEVHFAPGGDFYRVQLREQASLQTPQEGWAYFYHPGIERYARALFYP